MPANEHSPVNYRDPLPAETDVIIIGAGVIGISAAWYLAQQGQSVLVLEKGRVAGEQSSRNWGWVRQTGRDFAELPIMMESIRLWEQLDELTDQATGFKRGGCMFLAENEQELECYQAYLEQAADLGLETRVLDGQQTGKLLNDESGQWRASLYTPSDGRAEPFEAVPALATCLKDAGGLIREQCAVRCLDIQAGEVRGVHTEDGHVRADRVLLAGGAWSSRFLLQHGISLPQLMVKNTVARTSPCDPVFEGAACCSDLAFRRRRDGGYTLALADELEHFVEGQSFRHMKPYLPSLTASWDHMQIRFRAGLHDRIKMTGSPDADAVSVFEQQRVVDPQANPKSVKRMIDLIPRRMPGLGHVKIEESWAGQIDAMPDTVPVMDSINALPGLFLATGFSGHGFGIGPASGKIMAALLCGKKPAHDIDRFRFERFSDGSRLVLGPFI